LLYAAISLLIFDAADTFSPPPPLCHAIDTLIFALFSKMPFRCHYAMPLSRHDISPLADMLSARFSSAATLTIMPIIAIFSLFRLRH